MKRLIDAFFNSMAGLRHGFSNETAIRQELILLLLSLVIVPGITLDPWRMLALWASLLLLLLTELLNTGIEEVADLITREFSQGVKIAKDCGSAAVLAASLIAAGTWGIILWEWMFNADGFTHGWFGLLFV